MDKEPKQKSPAKRYAKNYPQLEGRKKLMTFLFKKSSCIACG